ncbi:MAG TPA: apolipoprotein N-acyltransferase, partial [Acidimicrobiales bacterium]|nr:apolipoprotein N-acyltransferase [Acidimicrobiales bacterium]
VAIFAAFFGVAAALCPPGRARWIALPALFALAEMARWRFPFGGEPLATLAMSQADAPLAQTARVAGAYLVVVLVVLGGIALSAAWERNWWVSGGIVVGLATCLLIADVAPRGHDVSRLRVAVVQGGGPQHTRAADTDDWVVFQREVHATEKIRGPVDLVLWPEDVVGLEGTLEQNPNYLHTLQRLARRLHTTMVVGVTETVSPTHFRNAAVVFNPDGSMGDRFDKVRRVPFGEYVPFRRLVEKLAGPDSGLPEHDAIAGTKPAVLHTRVGTFGVAISWEVFFADRARDAISHGGSVLLNPTNGSSYWLDVLQNQQLASSRLRSIETGRWTLQSSPTGYSAIFTPDGRITQRIGTSRQGVLTQTISERQGQTWSTEVGAWPVLVGSLLAVALAWVVTLRRRRARAASAAGPVEPGPDSGGSRRERAAPVEFEGAPDGDRLEEPAVVGDQ